MDIQNVRIDKIKPYKKNPRINDGAVEAVAASIKEFGFKVPIVIDKNNTIICGHTRWKAAKLLGLKTVPAIVADDLTPEQVKGLRIADNQTASLAEWDTALLQAEIDELENLGFDMNLLGFKEGELEELLAQVGAGGNDGLTDPDAVPEPPDEAISIRGQVYQLGSHRLMCGDSANPADLDILLGGQPIHLVNTDPPYNVKVEPRSNNAIAAGLSSFPANGGMTHHQKMDVERHPEKAHATHKKLRPKDRPLENDFVSDEQFDKLLDGWFGNIARVLLPGHGFYIWGGYANCGNYPPFLKKHELYFSQAIIWNKMHPVLTSKDFMGAHEWCFYGWKSGAAHRFFGPNNASDLWEVKKVNPQSMIHLTEKPVELAVLAIQYSSRKGENILDLFGGSGSTLIGCEQTGRNGYLMEIDPIYCDVIVKRWEDYTGNKAVLLNDH